VTGSRHSALVTDDPLRKPHAASDAGPKIPRHTVRVNRRQYPRFVVDVGTVVDVWMNLQARYEIEAARDAEGDIIEREIHPTPPWPPCRHRDA
jgi:hypothetical protein